MLNPPLQSLNNITGPTGFTGPGVGSTGPTGYTGFTGPSAGPIGPTGPTGPQPAYGTRVQSVADDNEVTPDADTDDFVDITALAQNVLIINASGTPVNAQKLTVRILDDSNGPYTITWDSDYINGGQALPTTTVTGKIITVSFIYDSANALDSWLCVDVATQA